MKELDDLDPEGHARQEMLDEMMHVLDVLHESPSEENVRVMSGEEKRLAKLEIEKNGEVVSGENLAAAKYKNAKMYDARRGWGARACPPVLAVHYCLRF